MIAEDVRGSFKCKSAAFQQKIPSGNSHQDQCDLCTLLVTSQNTLGTMRNLKCLSSSAHRSEFFPSFSKSSSCANVPFRSCEKAQISVLYYRYNKVIIRISIPSSRIAYYRLNDCDVILFSSSLFNDNIINLQCVDSYRPLGPSGSRSSGA